MDLASVLLGGPKSDDRTAHVFAEVEAERKADFARDVDLEVADQQQASRACAQAPSAS